MRVKAVTLRSAYTYPHVPESGVGWRWVAQTSVTSVSVSQRISVGVTYVISYICQNGND